MNILSKILNLAAARGIFGYHPKGKKLCITHLSFADDLLIFCKGNLESIVGVISVLNHFYSLSGLSLNVNKIEFYVARIYTGTLESIKSATGFKQGFLPVRYLGVPLVTRKLTKIDCFPLLDSFKTRLHHCSSFPKRLSIVLSSFALVSFGKDSIKLSNEPGLAGIDYAAPNLKEALV
ncbi:uncharacterized protein LOC120218923 [Hibiscus syriacus]|uniref:uncharacterized protein LOC120218923 n=1 Tax=Hibiscus syriacus TaxID=106335 RepID=UPI00192399DA|nr:uncharacterized protein LOC120218923 [Hibiscus syriacus]